VFEQVLITDSQPRRHAGRGTVPVSFAIHGVALGALIGAAFFSVGTILEPGSPERLIFAVLPPPLAAAAPAPLRGSSRREVVVEKRRLQEEKLPEMIQPEVVLEAIPEADNASEVLDQDGVPEGSSAGSLEGIPGGDPNGIPGGIPGGSPDGVIDGSLNGLPGMPRGESLDSDPIHLTGEVRPPILTRKVNPEYPETARVARVEGKVILEIVVNRAGEVEAVRVLKSHPLFDRAAIDAVSRWKYDPALQSGRPVRVYMTVVVDFRLK